MMTLNEILDYLNHLTTRERWMVYIGTTCLILTLGYTCIYSPLHQAIETNQASLADKIATLKWMKQVQQTPHTQSAKHLSQTQLLATLTDALNHTNFKTYPYHLAQTANGDIELKFDKVPFNRFLTWAWELNQHYQFNIKQLNAESIANTPGLVKLVWLINV